MLVVAWRSGPFPRAALAALSVAAFGFGGAEAPPEPDTLSTPPAQVWRVTTAPRAATWNLYGNRATDDGAPTTAEVLGQTDSPPRLVPYRPGSGLRAATRALYANPALEPSSTAAAVEPESVSAPPQIQWQPGRTPRAAVRNLYGNLAHEPSSTAPPAEPDTFSTVRRDTWKEARAPRAVVRNLYGNVTLEPSSTVAAPEPDTLSTIRRDVWKESKTPRAVVRNLYGNVATSDVEVVPPDTGPRGAIPPVISRWRTWRAPRAALAALYRYARFDFETGPAPVVVDDIIEVEFWRTNMNRTFTAPENPTFQRGSTAKVFIAQGNVELTGGPGNVEFSVGGG